VIHGAAAVAGTLLILLSLPGTFELALLTISGILPPKRHRRDRDSSITRIGKLAVIIPAHNESPSVARTVQSLMQCERPDALTDLAILVVADNCSDDTATVARMAGARIIERTDDSRRGKGYALQYAFDLLEAEAFDAFLVIDADSIVESNLLIEVVRLLEDGADGVQTRYGVLNPEDSIRTRLMNTALMAFNVLRPRGRDRLGLSAGILGNGFALTTATLTAVPYDAHSVVEDLEYGLRIVEARRRIAFVDHSTVRGLMPSSQRGVEDQRARWEGGRLGMIFRYVPRLARGVLRGNLAQSEPLLELLLLPLAFHTLLLTAAIVIPFAPARTYALIGFVVVGLHISAAVVIGGGDWRDFAALLAAPLYMAWKLKMLSKIFRSASIGTAWVRTDR
jgi:cellulose synthase/poly-beta-1,6-N-acetylglucosamine synthase-like glycosyltransferase